MNDFIFDAPEDLGAFVKQLDEYGYDARIIAGGTAMVTMLKQSLVQATNILSLHRIPGLRGIAVQDGMLRIGALTSHRAVETSDAVRKHTPLLAQVYSRVATVRIRNMATVGGCIAHADPAQDPLPGLLALGATVKLVSITGEREVPISELFVDYYETRIAPNEVLTEVAVPIQPPQSRACYFKYLPRSEDDYATVSVAAIAQLQNGLCHDLRIALGSVGSTPIRALEVEKTLEGQLPTKSLITRAAESVENDINPMDDIRGSSQYKRAMAVVFTRRVLSQLLELEN